jgi:ribosome-associated protein
MRASADASSAARAPAPVAVDLPITLGQFLKVAGWVGTGGEAKYLIVEGRVTVNGETEVRRGRHLVLGDVVATAEGQAATLVDEPLDS